MNDQPQPDSAKPQPDSAKPQIPKGGKDVRTRLEEVFVDGSPASEEISKLINEILGPSAQDLAKDLMVDMKPVIKKMLLQAVRKCMMINEAAANAAEHLDGHRKILGGFTSLTLMLEAKALCIPPRDVLDSVCKGTAVEVGDLLVELNFLVEMEFISVAADYLKATRETPASITPALYSDFIAEFPEFTI